MAGEQRRDAQDGMENIQIDVDVFGSKEVEMAPAPKIKRRRQQDDYDYNDPFFESFEGELDAVEIECKLENFFVYRGQMSEDPKKIARRHNRELKKRRLQDGTANADPSGGSASFSFERSLENAIAGNSKYKKEPPFANLIFWLFFIENSSDGFRAGDTAPSPVLRAILDAAEGTPVERYADALVLSRRRPDAAQDTLAACAPDPEEIAAYLEKTRIMAEAQYSAVAQRLGNPQNYEPEGRSYQLFKEEASMALFLRFYMLYIRYYVLCGEENVQMVRNRASEYLMASFLGTCTNNIKLKYYVRKSVEEMIRTCGHSLEEVLEGRLPCDAGAGPEASFAAGDAGQDTPVSTASLDLLNIPSHVADDDGLFKDS